MRVSPLSVAGAVHNRIPVLGWALWAELSPSSLRLVLRTLARARELRVGTALAAVRWVAWRTVPAVLRGGYELQC